MHRALGRLQILVLAELAEFLRKAWNLPIASAGAKTQDLCRRHGISDTTFEPLQMDGAVGWSGGLGCEASAVTGGDENRG